ncbi:suppressor of disruption of TFIIS-like protein [Corchorus olitorius]|uniref:Suppressor of disruption of TFIIS-like protein n=1 Tax=Corchorus olitorius TaxID=93759 RepID=A0A1R3KJ14_9ROSI|nr:suppressor of disruption of TFIIS-like protein [Corchorus olitorius]
MDSPFNSLLFDLDDTLYSSNIGIAEFVKKNVNDYLIEKCGFPENKATIIRDELFHSHGSTFAGLRALGYDIDADKYHE